MSPSLPTPLPLPAPPGSPAALGRWWSSSPRPGGPPASPRTCWSRPACWRAGRVTTLPWPPPRRGGAGRRRRPARGARRRPRPAGAARALADRRGAGRAVARRPAGRVRRRGRAAGGADRDRRGERPAGRSPGGGRPGGGGRRRGRRPLRDTAPCSRRSRRTPPVRPWSWPPRPGPSSAPAVGRTWRRSPCGWPSSCPGGEGAVAALGRQAADEVAPAGSASTLTAAVALASAGDAARVRRGAGRPARGRRGHLAAVGAGSRGRLPGGGPAGRATGRCIGGPGGPPRRARGGGARRHPSIRQPQQRPGRGGGGDGHGAGGRRRAHARRVWGPSAAGPRGRPGRADRGRRHRCRPAPRPGRGRRRRGGRSAGPVGGRAAAGRRPGVAGPARPALAGDGYSEPWARSSTWRRRRRGGGRAAGALLLALGEGLAPWQPRPGAGTTRGALAGIRAAVTGLVAGHPEVVLPVLDDAATGADLSAEADTAVRGLGITLMADPDSAAGVTRGRPHGAARRPGRRLRRLEAPAPTWRCSTTAGGCATRWTGPGRRAGPWTPTSSWTMGVHVPVACIPGALGDVAGAVRDRAVRRPGHER